MPAKGTYFFDGKKVCKKTATNKKFRFDLPLMSILPGLSNQNFALFVDSTRTSRSIQSLEIIFENSMCQKKAGDVLASKSASSKINEVGLGFDQTTLSNGLKKICDEKPVA